MDDFADFLDLNGRVWHNHYAWIPVKDKHGEWHWFSQIFKRKIIRENGHGDIWVYEYGTLLDVLKDS